MGLARRLTQVGPGKPLAPVRRPRGYCSPTCAVKTSAVVASIYKQMAQKHPDSWSLLRNKCSGNPDPLFHLAAQWSGGCCARVCPGPLLPLRPLRTLPASGPGQRRATPRSGRRQQAPERAQRSERGRSPAAEETPSVPELTPLPWLCGSCSSAELSKEFLKADVEPLQTSKAVKKKSNRTTV